jgi:hypothetical protein
MKNRRYTDYESNATPQFNPKGQTALILAFVLGASSGLTSVP